ncbi:MAG: PD-(D/E)XK nuclease family protein [Bacteroidaceae bacterium]|nr:PD-(D/E)XK nuclease family protein [Bacteroidaceae bacterium]
MTPFLKLVADDVYRRFNGRLENVAVVFPNKRAALFFNKYLLENNNNAPMWSPHYMTISELFQKGSDLTIGDPILLVSKLYKEYIAPFGNNKSVETLDNFYYWGEMLVRDFDDIDKNLADAKMLFSNIKELRELGNAKDTLTEKQAESIEQFFKNFNPEKESDVKKHFQDIWERLYTIYVNFKESLRKDKIAYEGMLYRDVIENDRLNEQELDKYVFVGFNALNGVERKLFKMFNDCGKALFYWDYDDHYVKANFHEAGHFMRKNLEAFPNALKGEKYDNLSKNKNVNIVSASSDGIQARYLSQWLDNNMSEQEIETAVVLCNETMLEPILHTIPETANGHPLEYLNVTMGYPISSTPIFSLIKHLVELQLRGWSEKRSAFSLLSVCEVLKHPYVISGSSNSVVLYEKLLKEKRFFPTFEELHADDFLKHIFTRHTDNKEWMESLATLVFDIARIVSKNDEGGEELYNKLFSEATLKVYTQIQRLIHLFEGGELQVEQRTAGRLLVKALSMQSMPFHGEPVVGLQVMGLLETRNLDFKNIIMLSVNEGDLPKSNGENSYIPYNLRRAFGLTLSEHRDSIYAYNFYRLLQRAENVTLVYNSSTDSKSGGECSRYILQLFGSKLYDVKHYSLSAEQGGKSLSNSSVYKTDAMLDILHKRFNKRVNPNAKLLTPSAINKYLKCKLSFFYYYILGLKPVEEVDTEMRPTDFGIVFHKAAEELYKSITKDGNVIDTDSIERYLKHPQHLDSIIDLAFQETFFKGGIPIYNGEQFINRGMLKQFLFHLLKIDKTATPLYYICGEGEVGMPYSVDCNGNTIDLEIGGTIDRIDVKADTVNIIDYKTGGGGRDTKTSLDDIFAHEGKSSGYRLQSFLYSIVIDEFLAGNPVKIKGGGCAWGDILKPLKPTKVSPNLFYVHKNCEGVDRRDFVVDVKDQPITDISTIKQDFLERLNAVLVEIFDRNIPFSPTEEAKRCEFCDYKNICGK